jgi:hypothetical protein
MLLALALTGLTTGPVFAGPLPPYILASRSPNGRFLAVKDYELSPATEPDAPRRILSTTYRILAAETFLNEKDHLAASVPFYSQRCQVRLEASGEFWPMVSDDGKSLILVGVSPPDPRPPLLKIDHCDFVSGSLVRELRLTDLWTGAQIASVGGMWTDATPEWFAGSSFSFSADGESLLYRSRWGDRITIGLEGGKVGRG